MIRKLLAWELYPFVLISMSAVLVFSLFSGFVMDDFNLHMMGGEYIVRTLSIPRIAIGSWYGEAVNLPWVAHEWLSEVLIYSTFHAIGVSPYSLYGVSLFFSLLFFLLFIARNKEVAKKHYLHALLFCITILASLNLFSLTRPQVFGFLTFYGEMWCLVSAWETKKYKRLLCVPVIAMLWANLHGGSSALAYGLPLIFASILIFPSTWMGSRIESFAPSWKEARLYLLVSLFSLLAVCINPYGLEMVRYPFVNMADTNMLTLVKEWIPADINDKGHFFLCFVPIFFIGFTLFLTERKVRLLDFVFFFIFFLMTLKSSRFIAYLDLYAILALGKYLGGEKLYIIPDETMRMKKNLRLTFVSVSVFLLGAIFLHSEGHLLEIKDNLTKRAGLFQRIEEEHPLRIWNRTLGDSLLKSNIKPFTDGRADAFTGEPFYLSSLVMPKNPKEVIEKYRFDYCLLRENDPLIPYIKSHPEMFEELYSESKHGATDTPYAFYKINNNNGKKDF